MATLLKYFFQLIIVILRPFRFLLFPYYLTKFIIKFCIRVFKRTVVILNLPLKLLIKLIIDRLHDFLRFNINAFAWVIFIIIIHIYWYPVAAPVESPQSYICLLYYKSKILFIIFFFIFMYGARNMGTTGLNYMHYFFDFTKQYVKHNKKKHIFPITIKNIKKIIKKIRGTYN